MPNVDEYELEELSAYGKGKLKPVASKNELAKFKAATLLLGLAVFCQATAGPTPAATRAEIDALLTRLESSGCDFNRNGSWYKGAEAKAHLLKKLEYLENKSTLRSTEQFIEQTASSSSSSGKPYLVKCGGANPQPSAQWLSKQLEGLRASGAGSSGKH
jgi:hypothetical protein